MNQTDKHPSRSAKLSAALFDDVLVPLAKARSAARASPYFPARGDRDAETYFERVSAGKMSAADFEFPGGGTPQGLIAALTAFWRAEGEQALSASASRLAAIAEALREEATADDGSVDPLCYTLF
jgi:hypothetical protein